MWFNRKIAQEEEKVFVNQTDDDIMNETKFLNLEKEINSLKQVVDQVNNGYVKIFNELEISKRRMELALMVTESFNEDGLTTTSKIDDDVIAVANNVLRNELESISKLQQQESKLINKQFNNK